jgi:hypothetical protein
MLTAGLSRHECTVLTHSIDGGYLGTLKYAATPDNVLRRSEGIS